MQCKPAMLGNALTLLRLSWGNKFPLSVVTEFGKMYLHHEEEWKEFLEHASDLVEKCVRTCFHTPFKKPIIKENKYSQ